MIFDCIKHLDQFDLIHSFHTDISISIIFLRRMNGQQNTCTLSIKSSLKFYVICSSIKNHLIMKKIT